MLERATARFAARQAGYTLIEAMTFATILLVVTGASIPVLGDIYSSFKLRTTVEALASEIQLAKLKAVNDNATVTLTLSSQDGTFGIQGQATRYLDNTVSFQSDPPAALMFDSRGRLTGTAAQTITLLGKNGRSYAITVNPSGRVTIQ